MQGALEPVLGDGGRAAGRVAGVAGVEPVALVIDDEAHDGGGVGPPEVELALGDEAPDGVHLGVVQAEDGLDVLGQVGVGEEQLGGHRLEQRGGPEVPVTSTADWVARTRAALRFRQVFAASAR